MKILWVEPGADFATKDVSDGLRLALRALGHNIGVYALGWHLIEAQSYLDYRWRKAGKPDQHPTRAEALFLAGGEILARALRHEADWVVIVSGANLHPDWLVLLKRAGVKVAVILTESPYEDGPQANYAAEAAVCFTNERLSVDLLRTKQPLTYYLPHSYDPSRHYVADIADLENMHDVVFVGTGWQERIELLQAVDFTGIDLALYGSWQALGSRNHLRRYLHGGTISNQQTVELYRRARIGLNLYRQRVSGGPLNGQTVAAESLNPRAVELAACGVFTLSEPRAEVTEIFGSAVPTFDTAKELEKLVRYYLAHERERLTLAAALPDLIANRTFTAQAKTLIEILEAYDGTQTR